MRVTLWPQSLFGRLIAATVLGVLIAEAVGLYLLTRNSERIVIEATTRLWARRITETVLLLDRLPSARRAQALARLRAGGEPGPMGPGFLRLRPRRAILDCASAGPCTLRARGPGQASGPIRFRGGVGARAGPPGDRGTPPPGQAPAAGAPPAFLGPQGPLARHRFFLAGRKFAFRRMRPDFVVRLPFRTHARQLLERHLRADLGAGYQVKVGPASAAAAKVIRIPAPFFSSPGGSTDFYDVQIRSPAHSALVFRVARLYPQMPLSRRLVLNLVLLVVVLVMALYVATRGITRPLSHLARAAEVIGDGGRAPQLAEQGARELRHAARAFNTMQDRLHRYLDSRTRVLAAMSHDLKTPLTRLRLQVETLIEDAALRARLGKELDEMEGMVHGALALFRGLDEQEAREPLDVNALIESVRKGFLEMGESVTVSGRALAPFPGRPRALKRCLTNLVGNAVKFGKRAEVTVQDGEAVRIHIRDEGPGIAPEELERVFEPFHRVEASRNRDTGGTGLGLSIARDVAQGHGGTVMLRNRPQGGLEAELILPRRTPLSFLKRH